MYPDFTPDSVSLAQHIKRFLKHVEKIEDGCWIWKGAARGGTHAVYGLIRGFNRRLIGAHVFSHQLFKGPIAEGLEIDHLCRNTICVNPEHLEAVTHSVNLLRAYTQCPNGHIYDEKTPRRKDTGTRYCQICNKQATRAFKERCQEIKKLAATLSIEEFVKQFPKR